MSTAVFGSTMRVCGADMGSCPRMSMSTGFGVVGAWLCGFARTWPFAGHLGDVRVVRDGLQCVGGCVLAVVGVDSEAAEVAGFDEAADGSLADVEPLGDVVGACGFCLFVDPCCGRCAVSLTCPPVWIWKA